MKLSVAIAAHPNREAQVGELLRKLDADVHVEWDRGNNPWETHKGAWQAFSEDATHHLVLQDDAVVCRQLIPALEHYLGKNINFPAKRPVSLYFGSAMSHPKIARAVERANHTNATWIRSSGTWWGVGILLPVGLAEDMLEFCKGRRENYDYRLSIWCEDRGYQVYYPWPSLINHLDAPSLIYPGRRAERKAVRFLGEEKSAFDWKPDHNIVQCGKPASRPIRLGNRKGGTRASTM